MNNKKDKFNSIIEDQQKALMRLEEILELEPTEIHKDAAIQRFEFSFELSWKLMQTAARFHGKDANSPRQSIRTAASLVFIDNPELWLEFLEARNLTTHTYDQPTADEVYEIAKKFLPHAKSLLQIISSEL